MKPTIIIPIQITSKEFLIFLHNLEYCLWAVKRQLVECDTIVVDFMSAESFIKPIKKLCGRFDMIYLRENRPDPKYGNCFSRGRSINAGIRKSTGDPVFFLDADCIIPPYYITKHLKFVSESAITFSPFYDTTKHIVRSGNYRSLIKQRKAIIGLRPNSYSHVGICRAWLNKYGGFDERYVGWGGEDDEIMLRFKRTKMRPVMVDTYPIHLWHPTWKELMIKVGKDKVQRETLKINRHMFWTYRGRGPRKK